MTPPDPARTPTLPFATPRSFGPLLPIAMLLTLGTVWGLSFSVAKVATNGGVPPIGYTFWQTVGAATVLLAICRIRRIPLRLGGRHIRYYLISGLIGIAVPNVVIIATIAHVPSGVAALILNTTPLMTYGLAVGFAMERLGWRTGAGILCGFVGALLLVLPEASLPAPEMAGWVAFGFLAPTGYALGNIFNARWRPTDSASLALACGMLFGAAVWVAPTVLLTGSFHPIGLPPAAADWAIFGQILISSLAYVLLFELLRVAGVVYLSQVGYIVALTAIVWGGVLFGERYSVWIWAAMALILTGVALVNWRSSRDRRAS